MARGNTKPPRLGLGSYMRKVQDLYGVPLRVPLKGSIGFRVSGGWGFRVSSFGAWNLGFRV